MDDTFNGGGNRAGSIRTAVFDRSLSLIRGQASIAGEQAL